jgi:hypothetical protein
MKQSARLRSPGVGHGEIARREDSRNLGDLRPRRLSLGSACEGKSRAHARISLNSLKYPTTEGLNGGGGGIRTSGTVYLTSRDGLLRDFRVNLWHPLDPLRQSVAAPFPASAPAAAAVHRPCRFPVAREFRRGVAGRLPGGWNGLHRRALY